MKNQNFFKKFDFLPLLHNLDTVVPILDRLLQMVNHILTSLLIVQRIPQTLILSPQILDQRKQSLGPSPAILLLLTLDLLALGTTGSSLSHSLLQILNLLTLLLHLGLLLPKQLILLVNSGALLLTAPLQILNLLPQPILIRLQLPNILNMLLQLPLEAIILVHNSLILLNQLSHLRGQLLDHSILLVLEGVPLVAESGSVASAADLRLLNESVVPARSLLDGLSVKLPVWLTVKLAVGLTLRHKLARRLTVKLPVGLALRHKLAILGLNLRLSVNHINLLRLTLRLDHRRQLMLLQRNPRLAVLRVDHRIGSVAHSPLPEHHRLHRLDSSGPMGQVVPSRLSNGYGRLRRVDGPQNLGADRSQPVGVLEAGDCSGGAELDQGGDIDFALWAWGASSPFDLVQTFDTGDLSVVDDPFSFVEV